MPISISQPSAGTPGWGTPIRQNLTAIGDALEQIRDERRSVEDVLGSLNTDEYRILGYNLGFDVWQRGTGPFTTTGYGPDLWELTVNAGAPSLSRATDGAFDSEYVATVTIGGASDDIDLRNYVPYEPAHTDFFRFCQGKAVTFSCDLKRSDAGHTVKLVIGDGVGSTESAALSVTGSVTRLTVTRTIDSAATTLWVAVRITTSAASGTISFTNGSVGVGTFTELPYIPRHPQDDVLGCMAVYQKLGFDVGFYDRIATVDWKYSLNYPVPMLATPAVTFNNGSPNTVTGGTFSTLEFIAVNNLSGYVHAVGATLTLDTIKSAGNVLELEVT